MQAVPNGRLAASEGPWRVADIACQHCYNGHKNTEALGDSAGTRPRIREGGKLRQKSKSALTDTSRFVGAAGKPT